VATSHSILSSRATMDDDTKNNDDDGGDGAQTPPSAATPPPQSPNADGDGYGHGQQQEATSDPTGPEWEAVKDKEGRTYYYNRATGESSWEVPPAAAAAAASGVGDAEGGDHEEAAAAVEEGGGGAEGGEGAAAPASASAAAAEGQEQRWTGYMTDQGTRYYFNEITGETQWERPEERPGVVVVNEEDIKPEAGEEGGAAEEGEEREEGEEEDDIDAAAMSGAVSADAERMEMDRERVEEQEEEGKEAGVPQRDPKEVALEVAEKGVARTDAVLEQDCLDHVAEIVDQLGSNVGGRKAMKEIIASNHGLTAICGVLGLWITGLRTTLGSANTGSESPAKVNAAAAAAVTSKSNGVSVASASSSASSAPDQVRSIVEGIVSRFATEQFSVEKGDSILDLSKAEAAFLENMIENKRWRRLLIDLSATYKDSALLTYCLKEISKRGHHREIAKRINQSDYFGVFNAMLTSELEFLGKVGLGETGADESPDTLDSVISNLIRTCTSTSYTYVYSRELLHGLTAGASQKWAEVEEKDSAEALALARAIRRWTRLNEELEAAMVLPESSIASGSSASAIVRKRRLDVAMMTSDLHQRQRQRIAPASKDEMPTVPERNTVRDNLDTAVEKLIRKYAMGLVLDNETAEALLRASYGNDKLLIGDILNAHPVALTALMDYLFRPGRLRVRSLELRHRCAKLMALASLAVRKALAKSYGEDDDAIEDNVDEFTKVVLRGSQLCEQIETMVSFTVVDDANFKEGGSVGRELSSLCIKNPVVAQGALIWSTERASGVEFVDSAAYPTLAPGILGLARIISIHHPLSRPSVQKIAFQFLKHSPPELSFKKVEALKEQALRLLLWLCTEGDAVRVFSAITSAGLDSALLRYFMSVVLQAMQPAYSLPLIRSMGALLCSKRCVDALRSPHFDASSKGLLAKLLVDFRETCSAKGGLTSSATANDKLLVANLTSLYS